MPLFSRNGGLIVSPLRKLKAIDVYTGILRSGITRKANERADSENNHRDNNKQHLLIAKLTSEQIEDAEEHVQ
jgi:hypothetical protein